MAEVVRTLIIRGKTEGVQESTADLKGLSSQTRELATITDIATKSQLSMEQALNRAQRQVNASAQSHKALTQSYGAASDSVQNFSKSLASQTAEFLNTINHLKLLALGAYALSPAFRSFINASIKDQVALLGGEFSLLSSALSKVMSFAAPALSFFSRIAVPIAIAVGVFEALNYVIKQGSELLTRYGDMGRSLFPELEKGFDKLTRFQQDTLTAEQVQYATELGGRLTIAKRELSDFLRVQVDTTNAALQLQNVWVVIVETIARGSSFLLNFKTAAEDAAQSFGNSPIWSKIFGVSSGPVPFPGATATTTDATGASAAAMQRARENLAIGLSENTKAQPGGTSFASRFGALTDLLNPREDTKAKAGEFDRLANAIGRATAAQEANALSEGKGAGEVARLRTEFRLMEAAQEDIVKNGGKIDDYSDRIKKLAERAGQAAQALEKAKLVSDISFGRQTALLSPEDVQIAERLRTLYGDDVPTALNSTYAAQLRLNDQLKATRGAADEFVSTSGSAITTSLADITTGTKNAADAFKDLGNSVIRSLEEMIIKMTITIPIARALQSAIGGFLPGGGGLGPASPPEGSYFAGTGFHRGGVVGSEPSFIRYIHPAYYENAPRFHTGLMPGEVPAILQQGESVLTPGQMSAIGGALRAPTVINNISVNNTAGNVANASIQQKKNASGGVDMVVLIEQIESHIAGNVSDGRGPLNAALVGRYGVTPHFS